MIYDKIDNLETYAGLSEDILLGLKWLRYVKPDVEPGVYELSSRVKAIVSEYTTKPVNDNGYEAHQKNIDIQYLLRGTEKIACLPVDELQETKPYNPSTDAAFYESNLRPLTLVLRPLTSFALFFPHDAHMPQLCVDKPEPVKKVVVKVKM